MGPSGETRLLYDGDALVAEYDAAGTLLKRYVHGAGVDEPVLEYAGSGTTNVRYLHADHLGSVVARTDAGGALDAISRYDAWGVPGSTNTGRFQYTGQIMLSELAPTAGGHGLYHYKARAYAPALGRFMQTDPIAYDDQMNLYAYVGNDGVNGRDPDGKCAVATAPDGKEFLVGVCPTKNSAYEEYEKQAIETAIGDPTSQISAVDAEAIKMRRIIEVKFSHQDLSIDRAGTERTGARNSRVTIDMSDSLVVFGRNIDTKAPEARVPTMGELLEHEVAGEALGILRGLPDGEGHEMGIQAENIYRMKNGIKWERNSTDKANLCDSRGNNCR